MAITGDSCRSKVISRAAFSAENAAKEIGRALPNSFQPCLPVDDVADEHLLGDQNRLVQLFGGDRTGFVLHVESTRCITQELDLVPAVKCLAGRRVAADLCHVAGNAHRIDVILLEELVERSVRERARQLFVD